MKKLIFILFTLSFGWHSSFTQAEDEPIFTEAELEQMLAPVALYPDSVLTHILIAATYPIEIIQADRWVKEHPDVKSGEAVNRVDDKPWDPNVKALVAFPSLLARMSDELDWTQKLGDAFLQDEERVLDSIQNLRQKADKAGSLSKMEHMVVDKVERKIVIQSVEPEVIYVPVYDTRVVYGPWYWMDYPPRYWHSYYPSYSGLYYWEPGVHISFNFFFSAFSWHEHHIVVSDYHYGHPYNHGYYGGTHVIHHHSARRWEHNPTHRHGVAYRTDHMRERFNSRRPSVEQQRVIRQQEHLLVNNQHRMEQNRTNSRHSGNVDAESRHPETRDSLLSQRLQNRSRNTEYSNNANRHPIRGSQTHTTREEPKGSHRENGHQTTPPIRNNTRPDVVRPERRLHEPQPSNIKIEPITRHQETRENKAPPISVEPSSSYDRERSDNRTHKSRSSPHVSSSYGSSSHRRSRGDKRDH